MQVERNGRVLGALLQSLGRLPTASAEEHGIAEAFLVGKGSSTEAAEGAALGLASLYRRTAQQHRPSTTVLEGVARALRSGGPMMRRAAMAAIVASNRADSTTLQFALNDKEREVRRLAALATVTQADLPGREVIIYQAWSDTVPAVRYEAVRAWTRHVPPGSSCARVLAATSDADMHVALFAIDFLGACGAAGASRLAAIAREPITPDGWHRPAHALVALARADSSAVTALLPNFVTSPVPWARMYGARAAEGAGLSQVLIHLARDSVAIVREAALAGLHRRVGHAADSLYLAALSSRDYMVLLTAAQALDSSTTPGVVEALGAAFARVTAERRETSRDPRIAMLESIEHIGSAPLATQLRDATQDFDSTVAQAAARIATRWTANRLQPEPVPLPLPPVPSWADMTAWANLTAVFTMRTGGVVRMKLRPFDAPTNVSRFVRMARSGWFNGLTFHRVVPNFVVQGGSPGANEYMGDGPFTRDELGLEHHTRGTVGISTRGRDTGDGQLFLNLIDNWRLDHDYTIIGDIVAGMEVVDAMQEGATIQRVDLVEEKP